MASREALIIESLFRIADKDGNDVDFILNSAQRRLDENLTHRDLVPKARQEGVSSYFLGRYLAACMMYRNTRAVVISHDVPSTQRLLARVKYMIENIRGPAPVVASMSKNEITFPKMNSMFYIGTAGAKKFGRGDTITHLHCSEYAYWPSAKELMVGLLQAVPVSGEIAIESTGNGFNDYHSRCMRAETGSSVWTNHFLPWHTFPEYSVELSEKEADFVMSNLNEDWEEPRLVARFGLTAGQVYWRRIKLDELDYDLGAFKQEYPMTLDECFQMSSESIFHHVRYDHTDRWERRESGFWVLRGHPRPETYNYVLGADVGGGVGKDASTCEVFCLETAEQVAEYTNDRIDPEMFAHKVAGIGKMFGECYAVVENNNHGILTLATLDDLYPVIKIHSDPSIAASSEERQLFQLGYRTTSRNKPLMYGSLRAILAREEWVIHSALLKSQLSTFIEHEGGKLGAQDGCEDDLVTAAACAAVGRNPASLSARQRALPPPAPPDPFSLMAIIEEMRARMGSYPIAPQDGWEN